MSRLTSMVCLLATTVKDIMSYVTPSVTEQPTAEEIQQALLDLPVDEQAALADQYYPALRQISGQPLADLLYPRHHSGYSVAQQMMLTRVARILRFESDEELSTAELARLIRKAMGRKVLAQPYKPTVPENPNLEVIYSKGMSTGQYMPFFAKRFPEMKLYKLRTDTMHVCQVRDILKEMGAVYGTVEEGVVRFVTGVPKTFFEGRFDTKATGKVLKRMKALAKTFFVQAELDKLRVGLIAEDEEDTLYDGAFLISETCLRQILSQVKPEMDYEFLGEDIEKMRTRLGDRPDLLELVLKRRAAGFERSYNRARGCRTFNARIFGPGIGLKGQALIVPDKYLERTVGGVSTQFDILTHPCNLKEELKGDPGTPFLIGMEPQFSKDTARTNVQFLINFPMFFPMEHLTRWVQDKCQKACRSVLRGEHFQDLVKLQMERDGDPDSQLLFARYAAAEIAALGYDLRQFPHLAMQYYRAVTGNMLKYKQTRSNGRRVDSIQIPIESSVHEQIVSHSMASLCGFAISSEDIDDGTLYRFPEMGLSVVSDKTYAERLVPNHGGCDQDDHFTLMFRKIEGKDLVITLRDPVDLDEFNIFKTCPLDVETNPKFIDLDIGMSLKECMARRRSENKVELLRPTPPKYVENPGAFSIEDLIQAVTTYAEGGNPGRYINMKMLVTMLTGRQLAVPFYEMETVIDCMTQGGSAEGVAEINTYVEKMKKIFGMDIEDPKKRAAALARLGIEIVGGRVRVDEEFFHSRGLGFKGWRKFVCLDPNGPYSTIVKMVRGIVEKATNHVEGQIAIYLTTPTKPYGNPTTKAGLIPEPFRVECSQEVHDLCMAFRSYVGKRGGDVSEVSVTNFRRLLNGRLGEAGNFCYTVSTFHNPKQDKQGKILEGILYYLKEDVLDYLKGFEGPGPDGSGPDEGPVPENPVSEVPREEEEEVKTVGGSSSYSVTKISSGVTKTYSSKEAVREVLRRVKEKYGFEKVSRLEDMILFYTETHDKVPAQVYRIIEERGPRTMKKLDECPPYYDHYCNDRYHLFQMEDDRDGIPVHIHFYEDGLNEDGSPDFSLIPDLPSTVVTYSAERKESEREKFYLNTPLASKEVLPESCDGIGEEDLHWVLIQKDMMEKMRTRFTTEFENFYNSQTNQFCFSLDCNLSKSVIRYITDNDIHVKMTAKEACSVILNTLYAREEGAKVYLCN